MSVLIADSGSTKTDWRLVTDQDNVSCQTEGFNPYFISREQMTDIINQKLKPLINNQSVSSIHFYGAGCAAEEKRALVRNVLQQSFPGTDIEVETDMLGAARALLGNKKGFAAILGTGSNSCWYDGKKITKSVDSLGFILGDEGSGAAIGKMILMDSMRNCLSPELDVKFFQFCQLTRDEIMKKVYNEPNANRFLASFVPFMVENYSFGEVRGILLNAFEGFMVEVVSGYNLPDGYPLNFVGSVASFFREQLEEAALTMGYSIGRVLQSPIEELVKFHQAEL